METKKGLTGKEKFAYGIGAVGKDMVYMLSASYVLYYFQDIMKTSAIAMGFILLIARVFDAFNDPIMGVIVAKTKTKWGKFRPWLLIGTITNAVILFLMFAAPPTLDGKGLIAYAAVTYIPAFQSSVADLRRMDRAPLLVTADPLDEQLRHGIESKLRRLRYEHVAGSHQEVCRIYCFEYILVAEKMDPFNITVYCINAESLCLIPVVEVRLGDSFYSRNHVLQIFPDILVVADIYI